MTTDYTTYDLALAAFLMASGLPLLAIESPGPRRKLFRFPPDAANLAATFYANALIPARAYANALRDLKASIYAAQGEHDHHGYRPARPTAR